jgi:hypothetical protein
MANLLIFWDQRRRKDCRVYNSLAPNGIQSQYDAIVVGGVFMNHEGYIKIQKHPYSTFR